MKTLSTILTIICLFICMSSTCFAESANRLDNNNSDVLTITCADIDSTGTVTAYATHLFYIENGSSATIQNPTWTLSLTGKDNNPVIVSTSHDLDFSINPIQDPDFYAITPDGKLDGIVSFSCTLDGTEYTVQPYNLAFDLKPTIVSISNTKITNSAPYRTIDFDVEYSGTDHLRVSVEEEATSALKNIIIQESSPAHVRVENVSLYYSVWIDIIARNNYGYITKTIELEPDENTSIDETFITPITLVEIFYLNGICLGKFTSVAEATEGLASGIYIVKEYTVNNQFRVKKIKI